MCCPCFSKGRLGGRFIRSYNLFIFKSYFCSSHIGCFGSNHDVLKDDTNMQRFGRILLVSKYARFTGCNFFVVHRKTAYNIRCVHVNFGKLLKHSYSFYPHHTLSFSWSTENLPIECMSWYLFFPILNMFVPDFLLNFNVEIKYTSTFEWFLKN